MAYETSTASDPADLLDKLTTFAQGAGWNVDYAGPITGTGGARGGNFAATSTALFMNKDGAHVAFFHDAAAGVSDDPGAFVGVAIYPGPFVSNPSSQAQQADMSPIGYCNKMGGPYQSYYFFADGPYLHVAVEIEPGLYRHFGVGTLEKAGAITTGAYAHFTRPNHNGTYINSFLDSRHAVPFDDHNGNAYQTAGVARGTLVRADSDGTSPRTTQVSTSSSWDARGGFRGDAGPLLALMDQKPSELTGQAVMLPMMIGINRPSSMHTWLGSPPDMRWLRIDNMTPGDTFSIGPDTWVAFPVTRKRGLAGQENSDNYGIAYRIVPNE